MHDVQVLNSLPSGSQVEDADRDVWTKDVYGLWSLDNADEGDFYHSRTADSIVDSYGPFRPLAAQAAEPEETEDGPADVVVEGVWIVWDSTVKDDLVGVFPADAEISALRLLNRNGYGHVEFQPFGEV